MAEKKRGFGALERRIHELEDEDRRREQQASTGREEPPRGQPPEAGKEDSKQKR